MLPETTPPRPASAGYTGSTSKSKLSHRLCTRSKHHLLAHADRFHGRTRLLAAQLAREILIEKGERHRDRMWNLHASATASSVIAESLIENLLQRQVLSTQNVSLSRPPAVETPPHAS